MQTSHVKFEMFIFGLQDLTKMTGRSAFVILQLAKGSHRCM